MKKKSPTALTAINIVDEVIEKLLVYSTKDSEPVHAAFLGMMIADLKRLKRLIHSISFKSANNRMTSLELCNQLFLRMLRKFKTIHKQFPFSIYNHKNIYECWAYN